VNAISPETFRHQAATGDAAADWPADDFADRAAALRAFRLTRTALPPALPTKMPPQQFEFWTTPLTAALRRWLRRRPGRRGTAGTADLPAR